MKKKNIYSIYNLKIKKSMVLGHQISLARIYTCGHPNKYILHELGKSIPNSLFIFDGLAKKEEKL